MPSFVVAFVQYWFIFAIEFSLFMAYIYFFGNPNEETGKTVLAFITILPFPIQYFIIWDKADNM